MFTEKTFAVIDTETKGGVKDTYCPAYHCGATAITRRETKSTINKIFLIIYNNKQFHIYFPLIEYFQ